MCLGAKVAMELSILEIPADWMSRLTFMVAISFIIFIFTPKAEPIYGRFKRFRSAWLGDTPIHKVIEDAYHEVSRRQSRHPSRRVWLTIRRFMMKSPSSYLGGPRTISYSRPSISKILSMVAGASSVSTRTSAMYLFPCPTLDEHG